MKKYTLSLNFPDRPTRIDYKKELNPEQLKVVTEAEGPCLVLAGPGSGKTRTLIYRLAYLLEKGIPAQNILLMTFTNKAAHEMQNRLEVILKAKPTGLWCGTFHHIGNRSIRMYSKHLALNENFGILDEEDQKALIRICSKEVKTGEGPDRLFPAPALIQAIISYSRNSKRDLEKTIFERYPQASAFIEEIKKIGRLYEQRKKKSNNLDYDDLLTDWIRLLKTSLLVNERFTRQFRYILVDEYQDTNRLQFDIIKLLSAFHRNILVVGDDAQSIYSFRAADIRNILDFPSNFEGTKIFKLETNYRSVSPILNIANNIIRKNEHQFPKQLTGSRKDGPSEKPNLIPVKDMYSQSAFIAQRVIELKEGGVPLDDIAVLYRAHYQSVEVELELVKRSIPYVIRGGVRFFEQAHIKDVLSYLRIIQNPQDEISWLRALSLHPGIGSGYADKIFQRIIKNKVSLKDALEEKIPPAGDPLPKRARAGFESFKKIMRPLLGEGDGSGADTMIHDILNNGYEGYILSNFENAEDRLDDIKELANFAHTYKDLKGFLTDITLREGFKGETLLNAPEGRDEAITLSTIHQAKGLEWKAVFIIGLCDGQFPHPKSSEEPAQLEEERRLFYVAVTRAKDQIYLLHPMTRFDYNYGTVISRPSPFLQELEEDSYERWEVEEACLE
ncbi:MAG: ATP-dependent helicase [Candidatus Omnitrophica bacterium]|nr:ATP-dependent helicase [Candidatus Omnitrophota bacterium]